MRKFFMGSALIFIFFNLLSHACYPADENERMRSQQAQNQQLLQRQQQSQQPPRPIMPPVVPSSPPGISPTPSPHITAPPMQIGPITTTPTSPFPAHSQPVIPVMLPSAPVQARLPMTGVPAQLPDTPVIGNSVGKVIEIGTGKDGVSWIKVQDDLFNETLKIKINPKSTPVIKESAVSSFKDIKTGDTVNVIFNQQAEDITASFVSILTEEDLKAMEEGSKTK